MPESAVVFIDLYKYRYIGNLMQHQSWVHQDCIKECLTLICALNSEMSNVVAQ